VRGGWLPPRTISRDTPVSASTPRSALAHAHRASDQLEVEENVEWLAVGLALGPAQAPEALARIEPLLDDVGEDRFLEATLCSLRESLTAISGRGAEAEELFVQARRAVDERDLHRNGYFAIHLGIAAPALSDKAGVEREQRAVCDALEEMGEKTMYSTVAAVFARTLFAEGRYDEAEHYTRASEAAAHPNDVLSHIFWRSTRAKVLAHRGDFGVAEDLAREAVAFAEQSDFLNGHAEALMDLAEVLELAGKSDQTAGVIDQALELYERKGNIVMAERARARSAELPKIQPVAD
jgi:ATP/maltotriose-dependent transcriptional regulator MalT